MHVGIQFGNMGDFVEKLSCVWVNIFNSSYFYNLQLKKNMYLVKKISTFFFTLLANPLPSLPSQTPTPATPPSLWLPRGALTGSCPSTGVRRTSTCLGAPRPHARDHSRWGRCMLRALYWGRGEGEGDLSILIYYVKLLGNDCFKLLIIY